MLRISPHLMAPRFHARFLSPGLAVETSLLHPRGLPVPAFNELKRVLLDTIHHPTSRAHFGETLELSEVRLRPIVDRCPSHGRSALAGFLTARSCASRAVKWPLGGAVDVPPRGANASAWGAIRVDSERIARVLHRHGPSRGACPGDVAIWARVAATCCVDLSHRQGDGELASRAV
jgi:hypothetical protein